MMEIMNTWTKKEMMKYSIKVTGDNDREMENIMIPKDIQMMVIPH